MAATVNPSRVSRHRKRRGCVKAGTGLTVFTVWLRTTKKPVTGLALFLNANFMPLEQVSLD